MLVNPLPQGRYVLSNNVRLRGVARNVSGRQQLSVRIDDGYGSCLLADGIDEQNTVSTHGTLKHACFQMLYRSFDQLLVGVFFKDRQYVLLNARQEKFLQSTLGNFHEQAVHRMATRAQRFPTSHHKRFKVLLEVQLNDLRANTAREHQGLERSQGSYRFLQPSIRLENITQPTTTALSR